MTMTMHGWLIDRVTDWQIDWSIDWLIDWSIDWSAWSYWLIAVIENTDALDQFSAAQHSDSNPLPL